MLHWTVSYYMDCCLEIIRKKLILTLKYFDMIYSIIYGTMTPNAVSIIFRISVACITRMVNLMWNKVFKLYFPRSDMPGIGSYGGTKGTIHRNYGSNYKRMYTARCSYNAVNFLANILKRHPTALWGVFCGSIIGWYSASVNSHDFVIS